MVVNTDQEKLIESFVEVRLKDRESFSIVVETLSRIGIASKHEKKLFQSCHILHKKGKYYLLSFKELFLLDRKPTDFTDNDKARRNTIANLLASWGLIELVNPEKTKDPVVPMNQIKVISHKQKKEEGWEIVTKYSIGAKK